MSTMNCPYSDAERRAAIKVYGILKLMKLEKKAGVEWTDDTQQEIEPDRPPERPAEPEPEGLHADERERLEQVRRLRAIDPKRDYGVEETMRIIDISSRNTLKGMHESDFFPRPHMVGERENWTGATLQMWLRWQGEDPENRKDRKNYNAARRRGDTSSFEEWMTR